MRFRAMMATAIGASLLVAGGTAVPAQAATTTCTWGGTPAAPTGTFTIRPGLTSTPAIEPLDFRATGPFAGGPGCSGRLTFTGQFHAGSSCSSTQSWDGRVKGLPGVARFAGAGTILSSSFMYDEA